jgi:hypothetical protein
MPLLNCSASISRITATVQAGISFEPLCAHLPQDSKIPTSVSDIIGPFKKLLSTCGRRETGFYQVPNLRLAFIRRCAPVLVGQIAAPANYFSRKAPALLIPSS